MPYAAFDPDCDVLNSPEPRDLARIAAESGKAGLIVFGWRFSDMREFAVLPARIRTLKISGAPRLASLDGIQPTSRSKTSLSAANARAKWFCSWERRRAAAGSSARNAIRSCWRRTSQSGST